MTVDVIIRTLAEAKRRDSLLRAIASLTEEQDHPVRPIIVVNGTRAEQGLVAELAKRRDACLVSIDGGLQEAMIAGRAAVTASSFAFLDDDDIYLPGGIDVLRAALDTAPHADAVVSNGIRMGATGGEPIIPDVEAAGRAPITAQRTGNWLHSGAGALFRAAAFPAAWFADVPPLFEWTWVAYRAALTRTLHFTPAVTYQVNNTESSLSKSLDMLLYESAFLEALQSLPLPVSERKFLRRKHALALHTISDECRRRGRHGLAVLYHLRSLFKPGGCRYLPYTRHLLVGSR